jgi:hypothetical protein
LLDEIIDDSVKLLTRQEITVSGATIEEGVTPFLGKLTRYSVDMAT